MKVVDSDSGIGDRYGTEIGVEDGFGVKIWSLGKLLTPFFFLFFFENMFAY